MCVGDRDREREGERALSRYVRPPLCRDVGRGELGQAGKAKFQRPCWPSLIGRAGDRKECQTPMRESFK